MISNCLKDDARKRELIQDLSRRGAALLVFCDEPPPAGLAATPFDTGFLLPPPHDYDALERWLYYGNWQAISPPVSGFRPLDTFRATDSALAQLMRHFHLHVLIDSFHDDIEWKVITARDGR